MYGTGVGDRFCRGQVVQGTGVGDRFCRGQILYRTGCVGDRLC